MRDAIRRHQTQSDAIRIEFEAIKRHLMARAHGYAATPRSSAASVMSSASSKKQSSPSRVNVVVGSSKRTNKG